MLRWTSRRHGRKSIQGLCVGNSVCKIYPRQKSKWLQFHDRHYYRVIFWRFCCLEGTRQYRWKEEQENGSFGWGEPTGRSIYCGFLCWNQTLRTFETDGIFNIIKNGKFRTMDICEMLLNFNQRYNQGRIINKYELHTAIESCKWITSYIEFMIFQDQVSRK